MPCPWRHPPERSSTQNQCLVWWDRKWKIAIVLNGWCLLMSVDNNQWRLMGSISLRSLKTYLRCQWWFTSGYSWIMKANAIGQSWMATIRAETFSFFDRQTQPAMWTITRVRRYKVENTIYIVYVNCRPYNDWLLSLLLGFGATMQLGVCHLIVSMCLWSLSWFSQPTLSKKEGLPRITHWMVSIGHILACFSNLLSSKWPSVMWWTGLINGIMLECAHASWYQFFPLT